MQARERRHVAGGIAEGELALQGHHAAQHGIGEAGGAGLHGAHELHALVDSRVRRLVQEQYLVGGDAQRVAHVILHVAGLVESTVQHLVERAPAARHPEREARGERAVLRAHARAVDAPGDDVLRVGVAATHVAADGEGREARRARLRRAVRGLVVTHVLPPMKASPA